MMPSEISSAYPIIFTIIWQSTLFIAAGLGASYLCRRQPARAHLVLLLSMIAIAVVPFMTIAVKHLELGIFTAEPGTAVEYVATSGGSLQPHDNPLPDVVPSVPVEPEKLGVPWRKILLVGWAEVSVIFLARLMLTFFLGIQLVKKARPLNHLKIADGVKAAAWKLGIKENVVVCRSGAVSSPVVWCWKRRPILLLPSDKRFLNDKIDLVGILCHELAHVKRRDHVAGLLSELMVVCLPWHPLVWWAKKRLSNLSEHACDDWVIAAGGCGVNYAESLLDLVPTRQMSFVPTVVRSKNVLKGRVLRMIKERYGNPRLGKKWILSSVLIAICISLSAAFAQTRSARPDVKDVPAVAPNQVSGLRGVLLSEEADAAFVEAQQRFEADPEDLAAAREPLIEFMETHASDSVPPEMYQLLGQFWAADERDENHLEEAGRVYATASAMFPDNVRFLFSHAQILQKLGLSENAAILFEGCYDLSDSHGAHYLEEAAMAYVDAGNMIEAKQVYSRLIDQAEAPEELWFGEIVRICRETGDQEGAEHYLRLAQEAGLSLPSESETAAGLPLHDGLPDADGVYDLAEAHVPPKALTVPSPSYPPEAKENGITGRVVVAFVVTTEGVTRDERVVEAQPPGVFEDAALDAVRQYRFTPATRNGVPVEVREELMPIIFELHDQASNEDVLHSLDEYGDGEVYDLSEVDTPPRVLKSFKSPYPFFAHRAGIEGQVVLRFVVDADGKATAPKVVAAEPEGVFEELALKGITGYEFIPATLDGVRVACLFEMPVVFKLDTGK